MTTLGVNGSVSLNYATKVVTAPALSGTLGGQFGESGQVQEGDVISFGVKTKGGTYFGDAVVASIASTTSLTIGSTAGLSGAAIAATSFQISQSPTFLLTDSHYTERNRSTHHMCMEWHQQVLQMHLALYMRQVLVGLVFKHMLTVMET